MKNLYIKDLKANDSVFGELFAVKTFQKITKNNTTYIDIVLTDKTDDIKAKVWSDAIPKIDDVQDGDIVSVTAKVQDHPQYGKQLIISELTKVDKFDAGDFMASSRYDIEEMWEEIGDYRKKVKNKYLTALLDSIFDKDFAERYKQGAAAFTIHHPYRGGLQEHTLEILAMCDAALARFPKMNSDLLYTGAILHDVGKAFDYDTGTTITMTFEGKMLGHIFVGANFVKEHAPKDMPKALLDEVLHMILSHHGTKDKGSPIQPKTAEAIALYAFDYASFMISPAYNTIQKSDEKTQFTEYNRHLGTDFYRSPYLNTLLNEDLPF